MNELSLFSGAGGGLLASMLLGWRTVGYVEFNDYCQRVIAARIKDGYLDKAPIFGDIRTFVSEGYAEQYRGMVDVMSAGFPCQPFSNAGRRLAEADERNMWPAVAETLRVVRPACAFLENTPGLLGGGHGYFGTVLEDLAALGFDATWGVFSACSAGAPHTRERLFILAHADGFHGETRLRPRDRQEAFIGPLQVPPRNHSQVRTHWMDTIRRNAGSGAGHPHRVDRLKAIGNGQVPRVAATAWRLLSGFS